MMDMHEELVELVNEGIDRCSRTLTLGERIAGRLIESDVTVQKWISVDERLPEEDGTYLVTINYFGTYQNVTIRLFAKDSKTIDDECKWSGQKNMWYFYDGGYGYVSTDYVTHWMPLPQPPK